MSLWSSPFNVSPWSKANEGGVGGCLEVRNNNVYAKVNGATPRYSKRRLNEKHVCEIKIVKCERQMFKVFYPKKKKKKKKKKETEV
jgi:hypothetical protein